MIEPQIAAVVIERGLARPSAGMPASWRKTNVAKAVSRRSRGKGRGLGLPGLNLINKIIRTVTGLFATVLDDKKLLVVPVIAGAAFLTASSGSLEVLKKFDMRPINRMITLPKSPAQTRTSRHVNVMELNENLQRTGKKSSNNNKKSINIDSMESFQGKSYRSWLEKLR